MYYDYFLMHRAMQIQKLRAVEEGNRLELPSWIARSGSSKSVGKLCRAIEAICGWDLGDKPKRDRWSWLKVRSSKWWPKATAGDPDENTAGAADGAEQPMIAAEQRAVINDLETDLVRARLGDDASAAEFAAAIMQALWRDADFFNGVKPLAFHTEQFVYEFLYPTWLNLYSVVSAGGPGDAKFTTPQVKTIFDFLEGYERGGTSRDPELVGLMTFIAHRYPAEESQDLMQRLVDLCGCPDSELSVAAAVTVRPLREVARTLAEFRQLLRYYLVVESCLHKDAIRSTHHLAPKTSTDRPLPPAIQTALRQLEREFGPDNPYPKLIQAVGRVVTSSGGFAGEFEALLNRHASGVLDLMGLVVPQDQSLCPLPPDGQRLTARLLTREHERGGMLELDRVRPFACDLARRMHGLHEGLERLVTAEFIDDAAHRKLLLDSLGDPAKRSQLAARLTGAAKKTSDRDRFFDLVELAAVLDPAREDQCLQRIRQSLQVLRLAVEDGTIVSTQLADLVLDLQQHLPASVDYLEAPARAAGLKAARLKSLYGTLEHERDTYARTGKIGNFSKSHAAFSHAQRADQGEHA